MMYKELVKRLRDRAGAFDYDGRPDIACDYEQAADAIGELESVVDNLNYLNKTNPRWIPVKERLPENVRDVQITVFWHDAWRTMYGYYDGSFWHLYAPMHSDIADVEVIGWMEKPAPMPTPPKEAQDND